MRMMPSMISGSVPSIVNCNPQRRNGSRRSPPRLDSKREHTVSAGGLGVVDHLLDQVLDVRAPPKSIFLVQTSGPMTECSGIDAIVAPSATAAHQHDFGRDEKRPEVTVGRVVHAVEAACPRRAGSR